MELIQKYVYAVTKRLPKNQRDEVERELEANIADMLPESPTEAEIEAVLLKLGRPEALAAEYLPKKFLISPQLYGFYIYVLTRCIIPMMAGISVALAVLDGLDGGMSVFMLISTAISHFAFVTLPQGLFWTTLGFVIYERAGTKEKEWNPKDLEAVPAAKSRAISRSDSLSELVGAIASVGLILVATFITRGESLFNAETITFFLPFFAALIALAAAVTITKFRQKVWTLKLAIFNAAYNAAFAALSFAFFLHPNILNPQIDEILGIPFMEHSGNIIFTILAIIAIICIIDVISGFRKAFAKA
ncbi:MAG: hypothetical protein LBE35_03165 [Clostridiales bacterium]|jgi:isoprenylcysteine carboxyl methyltransferase (ICMT) family protein YpbQ|nr:hypothetical protein [Clostridiales bacterium]